MDITHPNLCAEWKQKLNGNILPSKVTRGSNLVWGVNNETHEITGTTFDYRVDVKNEPLEHYLARQITPDNNFSFHEITLEGKRVVVMVVPAASKIPTGFDENRYLRIGSSKVNLNKYPERESNLFYILRVGLPTMCNTESEYQDLTFDKLFDEEAYREAVINAFVHNQWTTGNAPMLTVFSDRIYGKVLQEQFKLNK